MAIKVTSRYGEPGEVLLHRFKRMCVKAGLFREVKRRRFFEKPSDRRRREEKEQARAIRRAARRPARGAPGRRRTTK